MQKVNLAEKLALFSENWSPKVAGELNGQQVKLVKFQGEFVWHRHDAEDELFLVVHGSFRMDYRESGEERGIDLHEGEFLIVLSVPEISQALFSRFGNWPATSVMKFRHRQVWPFDLQLNRIVFAARWARIRRKIACALCCLILKRRIRCAARGRRAWRRTHLAFRDAAGTRSDANL